MNFTYNIFKSILKILYFIIFGILIGFISSNNFFSTNCNPILLSNLTTTKANSLPWYDKKFYYKGLVSVLQYNSNIVVDLRYATNNNFTKKQIYDKSICLLQEKTLKKLISANEEFNSLGYKIKIWDAFRPKHIQLYLWDLIKDRRFIASPYVNWSRHNRGSAIDITLVTMDNKELEMPTGFDTFSEKSYRNALDISENAKKNSELLSSIMIKHGFKTIDTEWWHFDDSNADIYPLIDLDFSHLP